MVQTELQYICIYQCLLTVLEGKENTSPIREIHDNQGYEGKIFALISLFECLSSIMSDCFGRGLVFGRIIGGGRTEPNHFDMFVNCQMSQLNLELCAKL